jgi:hypothetical protein
MVDRFIRHTWFAAYHCERHIAVDETRTFVVVLEPDIEEGRFVVRVPAAGEPVRLLHPFSRVAPSLHSSCVRPRRYLCFLNNSWRYLLASRQAWHLTLIQSHYPDLPSASGQGFHGNGFSSLAQLRKRATSENQIDSELPNRTKN